VNLQKNDDIGCHSYPVDIHVNKNTTSATEKMHEMIRNSSYNEGEFYGIPYRSLIPQGVKNAYVVGDACPAIG